MLAEEPRREQRGEQEPEPEPQRSRSRSHSCCRSCSRSRSRSPAERSRVRHAERGARVVARAAVAQDLGPDAHAAARVRRRCSSAAGAREPGVVHAAVLLAAAVAAGPDHRAPAELHDLRDDPGLLRLARRAVDGLRAARQRRGQGRRQGRAGRQQPTRRWPGLEDRTHLAGGGGAALLARVRRDGQHRRLRHGGDREQRGVRALLRPALARPAVPRAVRAAGADAGDRWPHARLFDPAAAARSATAGGRGPRRLRLRAGAALLALQRHRRCVRHPPRRSPSLTACAACPQCRKC